uniref:Uncharacterized protein n=1 Tax=Branchiostoma floridae TaxID=7739 RepID=C3ZTL5_BRAFL|eukprot:XP_002588111.1 hypothetical protein BRAFLDRAFT_87631 [Branchiostoma floridae]
MAYISSLVKSSFVWHINTIYGTRNVLKTRSSSYSEWYQCDHPFTRLRDHPLRKRGVRTLERTAEKGVYSAKKRREDVTPPVFTAVGLHQSLLPRGMSIALSATRLNNKGPNHVSWPVLRRGGIPWPMSS